MILLLPGEFFPWVYKTESEKESNGRTRGNLGGDFTCFDDVWLSGFVEKMLPQILDRRLYVLRTVFAMSDKSLLDGHQQNQASQAKLKPKSKLKVKPKIQTQNQTQTPNPKPKNPNPNPNPNPKSKADQWFSRGSSGTPHRSLSAMTWISRSTEEGSNAEAGIGADCAGESRRFAVSREGFNKGHSRRWHNVKPICRP